MVEEYVRSSEDEAMMKKASEDANIEDAERNKRIEKQENLLKQREELKLQIETINQELREMMGYDFFE